MRGKEGILKTALAVFLVLFQPESPGILLGRTSEGLGRRVKAPGSPSCQAPERCITANWFRACGAFQLQKLYFQSHQKKSVFARRQLQATSGRSGDEKEQTHSGNQGGDTSRSVFISAARRLLRSDPTTVDKDPKVLTLRESTRAAS